MTFAFLLCSWECIFSILLDEFSIFKITLEEIENFFELLFFGGFNHSVQFVLEDLFESSLDLRMELDDFVEFLFHELGKLFQCGIGDELTKHILKIIWESFRAVLFMVFAVEKGFELIEVPPGSFGIHSLMFCFCIIIKRINLLLIWWDSDIFYLKKNEMFYILLGNFSIYLSKQSQ